MTELGATPVVEAQSHGFPWGEVHASYLYFLSSGHRRWRDLQFGSFGGRCRRHLYCEDGHDEATERQGSYRHSLPDPHCSRFLDSFSASSRTMALPNMPGGDDNLVPTRIPRLHRVELGVSAHGKEHRWERCRWADPGRSQAFRGVAARRPQRGGRPGTPLSRALYERQRQLDADCGSIDNVSRLVEESAHVDE